MKFLLGLQIGLKEIWAHKFRSVLTMLGIILGVASLLAMFSLTEGMARGMREIMQSTGGVERIQVINKDVSENLQDIAFLSPGRTMLDADAIRKGAPLIDLVASESMLGGAAVTRGSNIIRTNVIGGVPEFAEMGKYTIERGRMLSELDVDSANHVVVLGKTIVDQLWPGQANVDPVGSIIQINSRPFRVIGTFPLFETEETRKRRVTGLTRAAEERRAQRRGDAKGRPKRSTTGGGWDPFFQKNRAVVIPITTMFYEFKSAQDAGGGLFLPNYKLDNFSLRVADLTRFEDALAQVRGVLDRTHRGIDDFGFDTREEWFESVETAVRSARATGGLIAGISLLVGGIGITNIMLASITERIREIGVRRAIGARGIDIFVQIVVESTVIGLIGGLIGLLASTGLVRLLVLISPIENSPVMTPTSVVISFSFAVFVGIFSGLYPAWKASHLDPIEALRYG